jgi:hypothetical protein
MPQITDNRAYFINNRPLRFQIPAPDLSSATIWVGAQIDVQAAVISDLALASASALALALALALASAPLP